MKTPSSARILADILGDARVEHSYDATVRSGGKQILKRIRQLVILLIDSKKPASTGWRGTLGQAKRLAENAASNMPTLVSQMLEATWNHTQLSGWKDFAAALLALHKLTETDVGKVVEQVVLQCKNTNDDMQRRMHEREVRNFGEEAPPLSTIERKDISEEGKWRCWGQWTLDEFAKKGDVNRGFPHKLLQMLENAMETEAPPLEVLDMLKHIPPPPGHVTAEERAKGDKLRRAAELAQEEEWMTASAADEKDVGGAAAWASEQRTAKRPRVNGLDEWGFGPINENTPPGKPLL